MVSTKLFCAFSVSSTPKSRARKNATPPGGCFSGRKSSALGTTRLKTQWRPTSSTNRTFAVSNSENTGWNQIKNKGMIVWLKCLVFKPRQGRKARWELLLSDI